MKLTQAEALQAIQARVSGQITHPVLVKSGLVLTDNLTIDVLDLANMAVAKEQLVTRQEAMDKGYATYNNQSHLLVDLPDDNLTVTCKTSDGRRATFAFQHYTENTPSQCCDIKFHDSGYHTKNGNSQVSIQCCAVYTPGHPIHVSKFDDAQPCSLIVLNMQRG